MITCPKCNKELSEEVRYCDACGEKVLEKVICSACGEKNNPQYAFCQKCGANLKKGKKISKKSSKKCLIVGGIVVAAIVGIVFVVLAFLGLEKGEIQKNYGLYLKDGEIFYTDFSENGGMELTSRLWINDNFSNEDWAEISSEIGLFIAFSENSNRIFYMDRVDEGADGATIYYRDIDKPEKEAVKIDSDIRAYAINKEGDCIVYLKGREESVLYRYNLVDKEKIASDVNSFLTTEDLSKIAYLKGGDACYMWYANSESVKMASDFTWLYLSEDLEELYYIKDNDLYRQTENVEDREKIASDVQEVIRVYESGEVYYVKEELSEIKLMDYVNDDMSVADAKITKPVYPTFPDEPEYPLQWNYDTTWEYEEAARQYYSDYAAWDKECRRLQEIYKGELEIYEEKEKRDSLREKLEAGRVQVKEYSLYYYDGKESALVADDMVDDEYSIAFAEDTAVAVIGVYNHSEIQKANLSEITDEEEVETMIEAALNSSFDIYTALGADLTIIEHNAASCFTISAEGSEIYFLDDISERGDGDLYRITISKDKVNKPELYDSGVNQYGIGYVKDNTLAYYKNVNWNARKGDLYINKKEIDYDVLLCSTNYEGNELLYYVDWNFDKGYGTLKMYKGGGKTKIADDVHAAWSMADGEILYLYDYSMNYYKGTLYRYNNGEPEKIDDDVAGIIVPCDKIIKGMTDY